MRQEHNFSYSEQLRGRQTCTFLYKVTENHIAAEATNLSCCVSYPLLHVGYPLLALTHTMHVSTEPFLISSYFPLTSMRVPRDPCKIKEVLEKTGE